jgi:hypothetical protein
MYFKGWDKLVGKSNPEGEQAGLVGFCVKNCFLVTTDTPYQRSKHLETRSRYQSTKLRRATNEGVYI